MKKNKLLIIVILGIILILIITIVVFIFIPNGNAVLGLYGDFFGGIMGTIVATFTLLYLIFTVDEMKNQNKLILNQNEHNSFIMLLHNYHEIINDLDTIDKNLNITLTGREAIKHILDNEGDIENLNHIVASANIIFDFPKRFHGNNAELNERRKKNQELFKATLSPYEKKAILRVIDNVPINLYSEPKFTDYINSRINGPIV